MPQLHFPKKKSEDLLLLLGSSTLKPRMKKLRSKALRLSRSELEVFLEKVQTGETKHSNSKRPWKPIRNNKVGGLPVVGFDPSTYRVQIPRVPMDKAVCRGYNSIYN